VTVSDGDVRSPGQPQDVVDDVVPGPVCGGQDRLRVELHGEASAFTVLDGHDDVPDHRAHLESGDFLRRGVKGVVAPYGELGGQAPEQSAADHLDPAGLAVPAIE